MKSRSTVMVNNGIATSTHELASYWGSNTLLNGGNVVDAAITTSAVLAVTQNNLCGIGGDLFALIKINGKKIEGLNGSGRAGERATIDFYHENDFSKIPSRGPLAANTVPGLVHAWGELSSKYGTIELSELLKPAIDYAENGFPITEKYAGSIRLSNPALGEYKGWKSLFLPSGEVPAIGTIFKQTDLAKSLKAIAEEGPSVFYNGHLADEIAKGIDENGGLLTGDDFRKHTSTWIPPLKTNYRGMDIYETAPNSQGATVLLWLNMLEEFDIKKYSEEPENLMELYLETGLKAYAERNKHVTDPEYHKLPSEFTSKEFAHSVLNSRTAPISAEKQSNDDGDTTYFAIADGEGNGLSVIQSNYMGFGSGLVPTGTGFVLHNRGSYFSLDPEHHNAIEPRKRTFHTLCASMGEVDGETRFILGTMGGDIQPQVHVQLMTKILDLEMDMQDALDSPRWVFPGTIYEGPSKLQMEEPLYKRIGRKQYKALNVEILPEHSSLTGHAQGIFFGERGGLFGGADPRSDGAAVGF